MFFYKDKSFEQGLEYIQEALTRMRSEYDKVKSAIIPDGMKIQTIESCGKLVGKRYSHISSYDKQDYWGNPQLIDKICSNATNHLTEITQQVEKTHTNNIEKLKINNKIKNHILTLFEQIGITAEYSTFDYKTTRSRKRTETKHYAGFTNDLTRTCDTDDGYEYALERLKKFKWDIESYRKTETEKVSIAKKRKESELLKQKSVNDAIIILNKYNQQINDDYTLDNAVEKAQEIQMDEGELFSKYAIDIIHGDFDNVEQINIDITGEWKHGTIKTITIKSTITNNYYECEYYDSPNDMTLDDMNSNLEFVSKQI